MTKPQLLLFPITLTSPFVYACWVLDIPLEISQEGPNPQPWLTRMPPNTPILHQQRDKRK